jgi:arylamine N-acetyltransferase
MKRPESPTTPKPLRAARAALPASGTPKARWGRSNRPRKGLLDRVLEKWSIARPEAPTAEALEALHAAYLAHVPFENATKLIKVARVGTAGAAIRGPVEFWEEHLRWGSGGTCFSSAAAYQFLLRYAGFTSQLLFCQLPASEEDAHTALAVTVEGRRILVDGGYALPTTVPLPDTTALRRVTPYYDIEVRRGVEDEYLVFSEDDRGQRFRYRFLLQEVGEAAFLQSWRKTFLPKAPYMRRLALGRFRDGVRYLYKDKDPSAIFVITRAGEEARPLPESRIPMLSKTFGLPQPLLEAAQRALESLLETPDP